MKSNNDNELTMTSNIDNKSNHKGCGEDIAVGLDVDLLELGLRLEVLVAPVRVIMIVERRHP